jgi:fibronectin-binding autotransporter adhesin
MRRSLALLVLSSACMFCVQAKAVTFTTLAVGATSSDFGPSTYTETFDNGPPLNSPVNSPANFTNAYSKWTSSTSTTAQIVNGSVGGQYAAPFFSPAADTSNYLSVFGRSTETIKLSSGLVGQSFGLFIGSLDSYNSITFYDGNTIVGTPYSGNDIATDFHLTANGGQSSTNSNRYVEFVDIGPFTSVVLGSTTNSFEVDNVALAYTGSLTQGVPEASTWIMMILGFLSVGLVGYRRTGLSLRLV